MFPWLVILFLLGVNAFYVAAEFSAVSLHISRLRPLAEKGNPLARQLLPFLEDSHNLDRYIAACQVGITWSSLVLGAYGQAALSPSLASLFQAVLRLEPATAFTVSAVIILAGLTLLQMVLGELVPKSLALHDPLRTGLVTVLPLRGSLWFYTWFIKLLNGSGWFLLRLMGQAPADHRHIHSPEELAHLLAESGQGGLLKPEEEGRLRSALRLSRRPVRQLMSHRTRMQVVPADTPPAELLRLIQKLPFSRLPVSGGGPDHIEGLIFAKDVLKFHLDKGCPPSPREIMRPVLFVPETLPADKLFMFLKERGTHLVMAVDEFGSISGLVTLDDLVAEMLGDMPDEFKQGNQGPQRLPDGRIRFPGAMRLDEAEAFLQSPWKGEADTVGGYVLESLGRLPRTGEKILLAGMELEVERMEGNLVVSVLLKPGVQETRNG